MFNPSSINEVLMQETHLEASKGKLGAQGMSNKPPKFEKESKRKKEKGKKEAIVKKDIEESTCSHC